jgi:hypothetical protein
MVETAKPLCSWVARFCRVAGIITEEVLVASSLLPQGQNQHETSAFTKILVVAEYAVVRSNFGVARWDRVCQSQ